MIKLYGTPISPYYNKVKLALMEKGVNFEEVLTAPSQDAALLDMSPMGKIPFVDINGYALAESTVILEWLEDAYPTASLLPPGPNGRARARELMTMLELYVLAPTAPLLRHALFGRPLDDSAKTEAATAIERGLQAVARRLDYAPWLAGQDFSFADLAAASVLPVVSDMTTAVLGRDLTQQLPGRDSYWQQLAARPSVARMWADREVALQALAARRAG